MFEALNEGLAEVKEQSLKQAKWEKRLTYLEQELERLETFRTHWEKRLAAEEQDVDRLKGLSISAFLYAVVGKKEEKLKQEQVEAIEAKLKYEAAERAFREARQQIGQLRASLQEVQNWKIEYDRIFQTKETRLLQENGALREMAEEVAELTAQDKELGEAIRAGESVRYDLSRAKEKLGSAKNWGTYDMLGGGMISTHIKHSRVDEAMEHIYAAESGLRRFEEELDDVGGNWRAEFNVSELLKFSDYFFDGLISDWLVQGRIKETLDQVESKQSEVESMVSELGTVRQSVNARLVKLRQQYVQTIEQYE
ncbi:hypothetical protein [Paenibacillus caui]|uniref:hypothetical protein n=1 Tax=Paenibacillus caui TaxID=2873927 RepID=UPI001CA82932|nr:hypothetical protein [Paenibacillus caui]